MAQSFFQTPRRLNENGSTAAFLNGKSVQRNDITKRKTALGDIKNYAPMTPGIGCDKKSANSLNVDQLNLLADIDMLTTTPPTNPSDRCSSKPIDFERVWAERLLLSDAEVSCILPKGYYIDDRDLLPPPPPPSSLHDMDMMAPPEFYSDMVDLLPPPLDFGDHFLVDPEPMKQNSYSDDESSLNRSIFEFSDADLSFDDLSNNFAGRMHF